MISLAIYTMHPIQYHAPIFRELHKVDGLEASVLYGDDIGIKELDNPEFNTVIRWDIPLLDGYSSIFLRIILGGALLDFSRELIQEWYIT